MERHYFECMCSSDDHRLVITTHNEEKELYFHYFLVTEVWYKRIWIAIKYIFGRKCVYGHFGETMLDEKNVIRLKNFCEKVLEEPK